VYLQVVFLTQRIKRHKITHTSQPKNCR
jgi:hypothetical protein